MTSTERLNRIKKARQGAVAAKPDEPEKKPEIDLDDPETQEKILHPKAVPINVGGKEYILQPLSAKKAREFNGLYEQVRVETFSGKSEAIIDRDGKPRPYPAIDRMSGIVAQKYGDDFLPFLAASTAEPGELSDTDCKALACEFSETISYLEQSLAFIVVCNLNNLFTGGKSPNA